MALDLASHNREGRQTHTVYLTYRVCVSLSVRQVGYPPPPADSHADSHGATPKRSKGGESFAGACKDEQAERGGKRRHMTKGQRAMIAAKIRGLYKNYTQRESAPNARPANFLRRLNEAKVAKEKLPDRVR